jgi:subtilase family serine protease
VDLPVFDVNAIRPAPRYTLFVRMNLNFCNVDSTGNRYYRNRGRYISKTIASLSATTNNDEQVLFFEAQWIKSR